MLPLAKAHELTRTLNLPKTSNPYRSLRQVADDQRVVSPLRSFFGVVARTWRSSATRPPSPLISPAYGLFAHQRRAAEDVNTLFSSNSRRVLLHMPTGSGKTRTAMDVVAGHLRSNEPTVVLWLAQNAELLSQAADEFNRAWGSLGNRDLTALRYWGSRRFDLPQVTDGFVVAGLAKLSSLDRRDPDQLLRLADLVSLVVFDEAHQAVATTYASLVSLLHGKRPTTRLLGLTATPGRTWSDIPEDQRLADFFGQDNKVVLTIDGYDNPVTFLIGAGYLSRPRFRTLTPSTGVRLTASALHALSAAVDVPLSTLTTLGEDILRNVAIVKEVEHLTQRHTRILVFAPSVQSARMVATVLSMRNCECHVVTAATPKDDRERIVSRFRSSVDKPLIVCNYGVLTAGFDVPRVSAALIARPTRSLVLYSQMVGRATRGPRAGGTETSEIVTVVDPQLPGFGSLADAFLNWEDVWHAPKHYDPS